MKKSLISALGSKVLAAATGAAVFISAYAPAAASAAQEVPLYISEVYLSYGKTPDEARQWLIDNGYAVVDQDLNEDADGLISTKRSVYLGYKTTVNIDEAITDMRAMYMNGDYSVESYEKLLHDRGQEIREFMNAFICALAEYRENYKAGKVKALIAHDNMNMYLDDDSGNAPRGDLLLEPIREEMSEEEYSAEPDRHADMTTILMQGNLTLVRELMSFMIYACDNSDTTWLQRIGNARDFEAFYEYYEADFTGYPDDDLYMVMSYYCDRETSGLLDCLNEIVGAYEVFNKAGLPLEASEEEIKAYFEKQNDAELTETEWVNAAVIVAAVKDVKYEGKTLYQIATDPGFNYNELEDRMYLYPLLDCFSEGQLALMQYLEPRDFIISGALDDEGWNKTYEQEKKKLKDQQPISIYTGILRSAFDPQGVAVTNEARNLLSSTGQSFDDGIFGIGIKNEHLAAFGVGLTLAAGGAILALVGSGAVETTMSLCDRYLYLTSETSRLNMAIVGKAEKARVGILNSLPENSELRADFMTSFEELILKSKNGTYDYLKPGVREKIQEVYENDADFNAILTEYYDDLNERRSIIEAVNNKTKLDNAVPGSGNYNYSIKGYFRRPALEMLGTAMCIAGLAISVYSAGCMIYDIYQYYHQEMKPIPRIMVNESRDSKGRANYTYYSCTLCNRAEQGFGNDALGDNGDMNGDVGKQWLALYTTKDKAAGEAITADIIAQKGSNRVPTDKGTSIKLFGKNDSVNLVSEEFCYNDGLNGLYIFVGNETKNAAPTVDPGDFEVKLVTETDNISEADTSVEPVSSSAAAEDQDTADASGSVVGTGIMVASCVGSAAVGALLCFLILRLRRKENAA